jgi:fumarate reductase subunit D
MAKKPLQLHEDLRRESEIKTSSDRSFGLVFAGFFGILAGLSGWREGQVWPYWLGAAAVMLVTALIFPRGLAPANRAWTRLGLLLFKVVNPIVMFVLYVITIVPMGKARQWLGHDPLRLRLDRKAASYWIDRDPPGPPPATMKNQF